MANKLTHLDALISAEQKRASTRIAKLQREFDLRLIELLKQHDLGLYDQLAKQAQVDLESAKATRSARAATNKKQRAEGVVADRRTLATPLATQGDDERSEVHG